MVTTAEKEIGLILPKYLYIGGIVPMKQLPLMVLVVEIWRQLAEHFEIYFIDTFSFDLYRNQHMFIEKGVPINLFYYYSNISSS